MRRRILARLTEAAKASDPIPVSEMVERVNKKLGSGSIKDLDGSNAKAKLKQAAREIKREREENTPPQTIDDSLIDKWVEDYSRKRKNK